MPKLKPGQATLFVDISSDARKLLEDASTKESMGDVLDNIISNFSKGTKNLSTQLRQPKRDANLSVIISEKNKVWLKKFCQKINSKMAQTIDLIIIDSLA